MQMISEHSRNYFDILGHTHNFKTFKIFLLFYFFFRVVMKKPKRKCEMGFARIINRASRAHKYLVCVAAKLKLVEQRRRDRSIEEEECRGYG